MHLWEQKLEDVKVRSFWICLISCNADWRLFVCSDSGSVVPILQDLDDHFYSLRAIEAVQTPIFKDFLQKLREIRPRVS
jgi:hypothetical protein